MADSSEFDLRTPEDAEAARKAVKAFIGRRKSQFTSRELAESTGTSMAQARRILNELIADGEVTYEGNTRNTVYQRA